MIYLDNASTTKTFDECFEVYKIYSSERFHNPSALSSLSISNFKDIMSAEKFILKKLGVNEGNVLFTSCATESNNLAIKGSLRTGNYEYVFSVGEHPSVYNVAKKLEMDGYHVHFVPLLADGTVELDKLESVLNENTRLISIMHVSNEVGSINDLSKICELKNKKCPKAIFHVDGVQGFMKIPFSLKNLSIDLYSFSGHKLHAPKGVAGLYVKNKSALKELFQGGGQQYGLRSGTENIAGIMQLQKAIELIDVEKNLERVKNLQQLFNENLKDDGIFIKNFEGSPYIENLIFSGVKGETMLRALDSRGVIVGLGSACSSKKAGNRVLQQMGWKVDDIISSVRISFNAYMTDEEILTASKVIKEVYNDMKRRVL